MIDQRHSTTARRHSSTLLGGLSLLATASALSLISASDAQASCNIIGSGTLNNLAAGDIAACSGVNSGVIISTTNDGVAVEVSGPGSTLDNSTISLLTNGNEYAQGFGSTTQDTDIQLGGAARALFQSGATANNLTLSMESGNFSLTAGAELNITGGALRFGGGGAGVTNIGIDGEINGTANTQYLILGLQGTQRVFLYGVLNGPSDGLLIDLGDDDDRILVDQSALITGGTLNNRYFHGGAGFDTLILDTSGANMVFDVNTASMEFLQVAGAGGILELHGVHEFDEVQIVGATLGVSDIQSLGNAGANIQFIGAGGTLQLNTPGGPGQDLTQSLHGGGRVHVTTGASVGLTGSNSGFNGTLEIDQFSYARLVSGTSAGTASILNNGELWIEAATPSTFSVLNAISGIGALDIRSDTSVILGANNSYSGDTIIRNDASLQIVGSDSVGTSDIRLEADGFLIINNGAADSVLSNLITQGGALIKEGAGVTDITNLNNSYSGGTLINGGALRVTDLAALGTGPVDSTLNGALILDNSGTMVVTTLLSGSGRFIKEGAGLLVVDDSNIYSGGTIIREGRLGLNDGQGLGAGDIDINTGAILGIGNITLDNDVSGGGLIIKTASGDAYLNGINTHTGGIDIQDGRLFVDTSVSLGSGNINIDPGATLVFDGAATETIANTLSGGGVFRMTGAGHISFSSAFSLNSLSIESGRVDVNAIGATNATVFSGATLGGVGTIVGNVANNGTIAPGNSIGTLTIQGNYVHDANAVLEIEFDAFGGIDLLDITGTADIQGGTVRFISLGGAEGMGGTFLNADGGVTGTFATVDTIGATIPIIVVYAANNVSMAPTLLSARPSTFNAQIVSAADTSFSFIDRIAANTALSERSQVWAEGFAASADRSADEATLGYAHDSAGAGTGVNVRVNNHLALGGAIGLANSELALSDNGGDGDQDGVFASLYARYEIGGWSILGGGMLGGVDQRTTRNVTFAGLATSIDAETSSSVLGGYFGIGRDLGALAGWALHAEARASILRQTQDAYIEDGASPLRLRVAEVEADTSETQIGVTALRSFSLGERALDLRFGLGVRHLDLEGAEIPVTFVMSAAGLTLEGDDRESTDSYFEAGLNYAVAPNVMLNAGYAGQAGETERHEARLGVALQF